MIVVGVAGRIGSGKSSVIRALDAAYRTKQSGWPCGVELVLLDADRLGHETYTPGSPLVDRLVQTFGSSIAEETPGGRGVNRTALAKIVFNDSAKLKQLTDLVWPAIAALARERIAAEWAARPSALERRRLVVLLEAAVLVEAKWYDLVDEVWLITADKETSCRRVLQKNPAWAPEQFERRWTAQEGIETIDQQLGKNSKHLEVYDNSVDSPDSSPQCAAQCLQRLSYLVNANNASGEPQRPPRSTASYGDPVAARL